MFSTSSRYHWDMKQLLGAITCLLLIALLTPFVRADKVDDFVKAQMDQHQIPGLALTIVRGGQETKTAAYGLANVELKSPARPETVFEIGSLTKQFTAACILLLVQDGKLSIDD